MRSPTYPAYCIHTGGKLPASHGRRGLGIYRSWETAVEGCLGHFEAFQAPSSLNQPAFSGAVGELVPEAVKLLSSSLEKEYLAVLRLSWFFFSAGAACGHCFELACRKVFTAERGH